MNHSLERRALYHLLRQHWLSGVTMDIEPWQVENYRDLPSADLFNRLNDFGIQLDKKAFTGHADECDSPEDLTEALIGDMTLNAKDEDRLYLIVFELWRRLMTEKPSPSIYCDELDFQIFLRDSEQDVDPIPLQSALSNFLEVLQTHVDAEMDPKEAFTRLSSYCANDIETFLYDFISDQIDQDNDLYAHELIDAFTPYVDDEKWLKLLRAQLLNRSNTKTAQHLFSELIEEYREENDFEFNLTLLEFISQKGNDPLFLPLAAYLRHMLEREEDFQDLLFICEEYATHSQNSQQAKVIHSILESRSKRNLESVFNQSDPDLALLSTTLGF